jgi:CheY-like chemotaxis protein
MMNSLRILLVDDSLADLRLMERVLAKQKIKLDVEKKTNGMDALSWLENQVYLPDLVILDLNMLGMSGLEVLRTIKESEEWRHIVVVVFTNSDDDHDKMKALQSYANSYHTKPLHYSDFNQVLTKICAYWLDHVDFPKKSLVI